MIDVKFLKPTGEQVDVIPPGWQTAQLAAVRQDDVDDVTLLIRLVGEPLSGTVAEASSVEPGTPVIDYLLRGQS